MIQYEQADNLYGSQYSSLNYIGAYYKSDTLRKIALVPLKEIQNINEIEKVVKSNANSILFIMPGEKISKEFEKLLDQVQTFLSTQTLYIPIYFVVESDELNEIVEQLKREYKQSTGEENKGILNYLGINQNLLHFSLSTSEPKKIDSLNLENFYGFLEGGATHGGTHNEIENLKKSDAERENENVDKDEDTIDLDEDEEKKESTTQNTPNSTSSSHTSSNPIIAIVTYYDSFAITPDMPSGLNTNGSGVVTLLELIRILSKFYENYESVIKYDILFVLTSAGNLNFEGTQKLIDSLDPSISENLHYVLCLDSLATSNVDDLYLHISRLPKENEENASRLYKIFSTTSENMNFNLNYTKKKIFLSNTVVPWEHEQFSKKKILAGTLSSRENPIVDLFNRTLITDSNVDMSKLKRNIKFLAESLLAFLFDYDIRNFTIFKDDENLLDESNLETYLNYLRKISRFPLNIQKGSQFNNDLMNFFNNYLVKTQRQVFEYKDFKFFDSNNGGIKIYSVKSKLIDLYLLIAILFYLFAIYIYTKVNFI
jgi:hypothetical protein